MGNAKIPSPFKYRGGWRAQVTLKNGTRPHQDFDELAGAKQWITKKLAEDDAEHSPKLGGPTQTNLAAALRYYAGVYTVIKGGAKAELDRINRYLEGDGQQPVRLGRDEKNALIVEDFARKKSPKAFQAHNDRRKDARSATYAHLNMLARKRCSMISTADIRELMAHMQREGLSVSTIQKEVALLRHMFNVAASEWNWKGFANPCKGIKLGKSDVRFVFLTPTQRDALWKALAECDNPYFWPLVEVAHQTTLRRASLLAMRWDNVDLEGRIAVLPSKSGQVVVPLTRHAVTVLGHLPRHETGKVFPMTGNAVDMAWDGVRQKASLPHLQFRDLRHLGATEFARAGLNEHQLQKILGHKTSHMAQVYVNLVQQDVLDAMDRVEAASTVIKITPPVIQDPKEAMRCKRSDRLVGALRKTLNQRGQPDATDTPEADAQPPHDVAVASQSPIARAPGDSATAHGDGGAAPDQASEDMPRPTGTHDTPPHGPGRTAVVIQGHFGRRH